MHTDKEKDSKFKWYQLSEEQVEAELHTDITNGLASNAIKTLQERYGANHLTEREKEPKWLKFMRQFHDVLIYVLIAAAVITLLLGQYIDMTVITMVIVINAFIGYIQENKAEKALNAIKNMLSLHANVIRDKQRQEIEAVELVVGDVVLLNAGDKAPADIRLTACDQLMVEESALTGESIPVEKSPEAINDDVTIGDQINMIFSGTSIASGSGRGIVVATGDETELGKINASIAEVDDQKTPLLQQTAAFGRQLSIAILAIGVLLFVFAFLFREYPTGELTLAVIGMIVAAIPEGLPAIMSIILALGVQNMVKRKAIVRNLPSVETLGSVSVICSDKTGTLTKNEMTVRTVLTSNDTYYVTGSGYSPQGEIQKEGRKVKIADHPDLRQFLLTVKTANDAVLTKDEIGQWTINGEPTDGSLMTLTEKEPQLNQLPIEAKIPFDSDYKYMAALTRYEGEKYILIKGAPDRLFDMAAFESAGDVLPFNRPHWEKKMTRLARKGERVIGAAYKKVDDQVTTIDHHDLNGDIVFLGLAGIMDPPRQEAIESVAACKNAGITVKMITGDHPETANAIGKQLDIGNDNGAIDGKTIDAMDDDELSDAVKHYNIFARTSPHNKLRLVEALQQNGEICSMTGDGVNDAPSLKKADIGVAMGIKGTEVAKDASEMVLVDDNFKTIVNAVEEGRRVYDNLKKTILFILPTNGAEALLMAGSILLGMSMALTPVQILWVNMITAVTISMALAFEGLEKGAMNRMPRPKSTPLLSGYYLFRIIYVSLIVGAGSLYMYIDLTNQGYAHATVQTVILNAIVFAELFYLYNARSEKEPALNRQFFANKIAFLVSGLLIVFQLIITYVPLFNTVFGTAAMQLAHWGYPISLGLIVFVIVEAEKALTRKLSSDD